jgi:CheY-like chemotaxis protein
MVKRSSSIPTASSKLLIVDDDAIQLRSLARAVGSARRDISVVGALGAREAIALLSKDPIDIVLSDLRMPEMDGFELVAWMQENTPQIAAFAMTAFWDKQAEEKLARLGDIECFTKPLDMASVVHRIDEVLAADFRGHIRNMSAASLLQIIHMDRKTCTLLMATPRKSGKLYIQKGEIVDARSGDSRGEPAALAMLGWPNPSISIDSRCRVSERSIDRSLTYLIMEAMRLVDETARDASTEPAASERAAPRRSSILPPPSSEALRAASPPAADTACISQFPLSAMKVLAVALVHAEGHILARSADETRELAAMAILASNALVELRNAQRHLASGQQIEEVVLTVSGLCYVIKPLASRDDAFVLLVFNPRDTSLAIRRADLEELARTVDQSWEPSTAEVPRHPFAQERRVAPGRPRS